MLQNLKSILVGLRYGENVPSPALQYGLALAQQAKAHASICIFLPKLVLTHAFVSSIAARLAAAENDRLQELAENALEQARQNAQARGLSCDAEVLQEPYSTLATSITQRACVQDFTVVDAQLEAIDLDRSVLEEVLFNSGHPLLIVPRNVDTFRIKNVVVAWDGSATAARAMSAALPFLRAAENVEIVRIHGEKYSAKTIPAADPAPYLARHAVKCTMTDIVAKDGDAAETLRSHVSQGGIDMLVMGAFAHSRLRELVLGGVTETMLNTCPVPLYLSH